jgi:hypothetical protein
MESNTFAACCGINIVSGFPYDTENDWVESELSNFLEDFPRLEGTYCQCHLIALTPTQSNAIPYVEAAGYKAIGTFPTAHTGHKYNVTLYAKGLTLFEAQKPKTPKPKKTRRGTVRRKK